MKLDEKKPYSRIFGMGGYSGYVQDGKRFNNRKELIGEEAPAPVAPVAEPTPAEPAPADPTGQVADQEAPAEDLASLHWQELKRRVEAAGGEWIDKAAAIAFLGGQK